MSTLQLAANNSRLLEYLNLASVQGFVIGQILTISEGEPGHKYGRGREQPGVCGRNGRLTANFKIQTDDIKEAQGVYGKRPGL